MSFTCNNPLCRITLSSGSGWVTFCSHIFCHGCGIAMEEKGSCTTCSMDLRAVGSQPARLGRINLAPSREEKMMALAGLGPKDIMEAASFGLSFYQRQVKGETADRERKIKSLRSRMNQLKNYHEQVVLQFKVKVTKMELELEEARRTEKLQNPTPGCMLEAIKHEQEDSLMDQFTKDAQGDEMMELFTKEEATTSKFLPRAVVELSDGGHLEDSFILENRRKASQSSITSGNYSSQLQGLLGPVGGFQRPRAGPIRLSSIPWTRPAAARMAPSWSSRPGQVRESRTGGREWEEDSMWPQLASKGNGKKNNHLF